MFKNKYVLVIGSAVLIFAVAAAGGIIFLKGDDKQASANLSAAASDKDTSPSNQPITISQDAMTGQPLSQGSSGGTNVPNGSQNSDATSEAAKLLDPKTFAQYDKYKDSQSVQYYDLQKGTGTAITAGSQVAVLYRGWLTNGSLFDESKTGTDGKIQAFSFVEGQHQVIPGWEAGLEGVKAGGVRLMIIPPSLGYGTSGQGPIPGNAVLIFQVQVVQVQ